MCNSTTPKDCKLASLILRIYKEAKRFDLAEYYHVLWAQNHQERLLANRASYLEVGNIREKDGILVTSIP